MGVFVIGLVKVVWWDSEVSGKQIVVKDAFSMSRVSGQEKYDSEKWIRCAFLEN